MPQLRTSDLLPPDGARC